MSDENILILGEKNLIRVAQARGAYVSDKTKDFLQASSEQIVADWRQHGYTTLNAVRENINRVYFTVDSTGLFTPDFVAELINKKGDDWKDFYPDVYSLANATPFLQRLDEKYRTYLLSMKPLFEEFNCVLQQFIYDPLNTQAHIASFLPRFTTLGMKVTNIIFEHRLYVHDEGKQIKAEVARIFYQQYTNFREFFLFNFKIPIHALILNNAPLSTGVSVVMNALGNTYTMWKEENLVCFPTDHILCPKIRIMNAQERKDFYEEQGSEGKMQLQQYASDPISKIYGLVPGNLIEIHRDLAFLKMPTEDTIAYRYIC